MSDSTDREIIERIGLAAIRRNERTTRRRNFRVALVFMAPAAILTTVVLILPILFNVYLSLTRWVKFKGLDEWGGLDNYAQLLSHPQFATALQNTIIWVAGSLVIPVALGLVLALSLRKIPFEGVFKN